MISFSSEGKDIIKGVQRTLSVLEKRDKKSLAIATGLMLVVGFLTNAPAVLLGSFVDEVFAGEAVIFSAAIPYIALISVILVAKEGLTVWRKLLVERVATGAEKHVTVTLLEQVLTMNSEAFFCSANWCTAWSNGSFDTGVGPFD